MLRFFLAYSLLMLGCGAARAQTSSPAADIREVARKYRLEIVTQAPQFPIKIRSGVIDGAEADRGDLDSYWPIFAFEWSLYPEDLVKRTGLKRVVFCKSLSFEKQFRTGIPDFENNVLYLDVNRGRHDDMYVRKVIHHEFFHIIDLRDDGKLYEDERWTGLNPPGFKYGPGGAKLQHDPTVTTTGNDAPGFFNRYAAAGVEEDKAEVFAHLMVEPRKVVERTRTDKYMRAKVERMNELLAEFSPFMNASFWQSVERASRQDIKTR